MLVETEECEDRVICPAGCCPILDKEAFCCQEDFCASTKEDCSTAANLQDWCGAGQIACGVGEDAGCCQDGEKCCWGSDWHICCASDTQHCVYVPGWEGFCMDN